MKLAHIGIYVREMQLMYAFYRDALAFSEVFRAYRDAEWIGQIIGIQKARVEIVKLVQHDADICIELLHLKGAQHFAGFRGSMPDRPGLRHFCLCVEGLDDWVDRIAKAGGRMISYANGSWGPVEIPEGPNKGTRVVYMEDPEGNVFELEERPKVSV